VCVSFRVTLPSRADSALTFPEQRWTQPVPADSPNTYRAIQTPIIGKRWPLRAHNQELIKRPPSSANTLDCTDIREPHSELISLLIEQTYIHHRMQIQACIMHTYEHRNHIISQRLCLLCRHSLSLHHTFEWVKVYEWFYQQAGWVSGRALVNVPLGAAFPLVITTLDGLCPQVLILQLDQGTASRMGKWRRQRQEKSRKRQIYIP